MIPVPIPKEGHGLLSVLLHEGSWPVEHGPLGVVEVGDWKVKLPVIGTIGTCDPAEWYHVIWFDGQAFETVLLSDVPNNAGTFECLKSHFDRHPGMWAPITDE